MNTLLNNQNNRRNLTKPSKSTVSTKATSKPISHLAKALPSTSLAHLPRLSYNRESMLSLDKEFLNDPLKVSQYCKDIFKHVLDKEVK